MKLQELNNKINDLLGRDIELKEYDNKELSIEEYFDRKNNILVSYTKDDDCFCIMSSCRFIYRYMNDRVEKVYNGDNPLRQLYVSKAKDLHSLMKKYYN